jgi:hypothetical protein
VIRQPFRLTRVWEKVAYVIAGWILVPVMLRFVMGHLGVQEPVTVAFEIALNFAVIGFGSRVFRARGEPVAPPRVWWRATGRPAAGFVLAGLFVFGTLSVIVSPDDFPGALVWWYLASDVPIVAFYAHSSIRLVRGDAPVPPRLPRDENARILKRSARF